uniref:N-acetyltransferase domain-containing protein n=1 Tax=Chromera velia CCMP2878 TaxID=1169474 RepID=A0A0G4G486_9ALVE|eukprot:Cvel_20057.t1-p1 / transcript=Cvel_20057.t1 / gene=Cvel_20057 / organism=Chromera_velia_CCMP2878 / gene_product=hypothetical protein / transcript_product=hypothetical protein / location=Cvel_scaffold1773:23306-23908(+) / protein_length=201 / sequence_SO=supercontig / SO=protein_coding / is_pseudo=false
MGDRDFQMQEGRPEDMNFIRQRLAAELMNPLFLDARNFLVVKREEAKSPAAEVGATQVPPTGLTGAPVAFGQVRPLSGERTPVYELASLYVEKPFRGRGLGTWLLKSLVERHKAENGDAPLFLLTLRGTIPFYERQGWRCVGRHKDLGGVATPDSTKAIETKKDAAAEEGLPKQLEVQIFLGNLIAGVARQEEVVCMKFDK